MRAKPIMILARKEEIRAWLKSIGQNQTWLAHKYAELTGTCTKGYISNILNNRCKISPCFIDMVLGLSHGTFEKFFYSDGAIDTRWFFGTNVSYGGKYIKKFEYDEIIAKTLGYLK